MINPYLLEQLILARQREVERAASRYWSTHAAPPPRSPACACEMEEAASAFISKSSVCTPCARI
ncbi:hypothetical protein [Alicyclobacillus macrosporangiidus]|uniref:hypothetical protein n=1 Tax=Alicyclobacillus macrosporangiidus TaxID=392015 RepID=UPI000497049D|nr:hypothetical protein [Alicyclobacillus macrosporangiidus]